MILQHSQFNQLLQSFPIAKFDFSNPQHLDELNQNSLQSIVNNIGQLPLLPPFEKHPYLCPLDPNDKHTGLMIGTFPPITYLTTSLNLPQLSYQMQKFTAPQIDYFHGNYSSLWKYAPLQFDIIQQAPRYIQPSLLEAALSNARITYTDIVKYTQRTLNTSGKYDAGDANLFSIIPHVEVFDYLWNAETINRIYFTNASFYSASSNFFSSNGKLNHNHKDAFSLFVRTAWFLGIDIAYSFYTPGSTWIPLNENQKTSSERRQINNDLSSKVVMKIKLSKNEKEKVFIICSSVSPAAVNRGTYRNPCVRAYATLYQQNPEATVQTTNDFIRFVLQHFFSNNCGLLQSLNC